MLGWRGIEGYAWTVGLSKEKGAPESERRRFMGQVTGKAHPGGWGRDEQV